ncbi:PREDICTED: uncharacterized protein LOC109583416 [Amphimedon queenslandica]|uniref:Uncharacterized protein n=1 Tax=Amphimedon queenslandica TaxID=400682 RepID=A0A1X7UHI7_AMPQE|nr:PREDICTED: uncharacterized protein LOC109583416 [Amphimedon queenslandica]|eukprot:XP_019854308.1 PREDICTED: uncharacterized protein LOC109583416 [Amphimedon queenslandica]
MRKKLLLHLPAVDVCQLEGTPVTSGIAMNEIWERLCKERSPVNEDDVPPVAAWSYESARYEPFDFSQITPGVLSKNFGIDCCWKDIYFNTFLKLLVEHGERTCEDCVYSHFNSDLLFGIYRFNETMELFDSFNFSIYSSHNVYRAALMCPRFTPQRYIEEYYDNSKRVVRDIGKVMKLLADSCHYLPKHISISLEQLNFWETIEKKYLHKETSLFLSSLEALNVEYLHIVSDSYRNAKLEFIANLIFNKIKPHIQVLGVFHRFDVIYPYIAKSKECQLRKFTVMCDAPTVDVVSKVLQKFKELEDVDILIHNWPLEPSAADTSKFTSFVGSMNELFYYPKMKELSFSTSTPVCTSGDIQAIFYHFFVSPYPVSLSLSLDCSVFSDQPQPQNIEYDMNQMSTKSLTVHDSSLTSDLVSLLPSNLSLRSLKLSQNETSTLHCFSNLKSIKISDTFTLALTKPDMDLLSQFLCIVTAKDWELDIRSIDAAEVILNFTSLVSSIEGRLKKLYIEYNRVESSIFTLFDYIFYSISATSPPYFELGLFVNESYYDDEAARVDHYMSIYESWKKTGAPKLKSIEISSRCPIDAVKVIMTDMTIELKFYS